MFKCAQTTILVFLIEHHRAFKYQCILCTVNFKAFRSKDVTVESLEALDFNEAAVIFIIKEG